MMTKQLSLVIAAVLLLACMGHSKRGCWTRWYSRDTPNKEGDFETLKQLRDEYPGQICPNPIYIEAVTIKGMIPAEKTGQSFNVYDIYTGFVCCNGDQKWGPCKNYKVCCGCPSS